ncbi:hypothetical protein ABZ479_38030 [Streptomyces sp. NPDC005722]
MLLEPEVRSATVFQVVVPADLAELLVCMRLPHPAVMAGDALLSVLERIDVGVVVRRMTFGLGRLPAYTDFEWRGDRTAVVRWNVELVLRWLVNGLSPDDYLRSELHEVLRTRAVAGQPIKDSILG